MVPASDLAGLNGNCGRTISHLVSLKMDSAMASDVANSQLAG